MKIKQDLKILFDLVQPYKKGVWLVLSLATIAAAISAFIPYLYGYLVDVAIFGQNNFTYILGILGFWLVLSLISDFLGRFNRRKGDNIGLMIENSFVAKLVNHIISLPLSCWRHYITLGLI